MIVCLEIAVTVLTAASWVTPVPVSENGRQSVTAAALWLQQQSDDVMEEIVHTLDDDYTQPTTITSSLRTALNEQSSTDVSNKTFNASGSDVSRQTEVTSTRSSTDAATTGQSTTSSSVSHVVESSLPVTMTTTNVKHAASTPNYVSASKHDNSPGSVFGSDVDSGRSVDSVTANTSSEQWPASTDISDYYYAEEVGAADNRSSLLIAGNDTDDAAASLAHESVESLHLSSMTGVDVSLSKETRNTSKPTTANEDLVGSHLEPDTWIYSRVSALTTSTASPDPKASYFARISPDSRWTNEIRAAEDGDLSSYVHSPGSLPGRYRPPWRVFQRPLRPTRRRSGYRQMLATPFVAGGRTLTETERRRALLQAYLMSGLAGKDLAHRQAMAAIFYRSKLPKPSSTHKEVVGPQETGNADVMTEWDSSTDSVSVTTRDEYRTEATSSWTVSVDHGSSTSNLTQLNYSSTVDWMSADNTTTNSTLDEQLAAASDSQRHRSVVSSGRAAVVIPVIVGFLESMTKKQFSWLDLTLAVCGTAAVVLGLVNLVVFVVHLCRVKRGKLSFTACATSDRRATGRLPVSKHMASSSPPSMSASSSSSDSAPLPPPPPPPPLPAFGGLARPSRELSRDVLADDETLRIRPLTFKRPLTDWGFTATSGAAGGQVTVKSTGSDASSSGVESTGEHSGVVTSRTARHHADNGNVINNYAYCGNVGIDNNGLIIDVDEFGHESYSSPSEFVFGKNYVELDTRRTATTLRPVTSTDDSDERKERKRSRKTQAKHRGRGRAVAARPGRPDTSRSGGLLSRPWKRLFGVSTDVNLPRR